jgi:DNA-binding response OmpR family regulator
MANIMLTEMSLRKRRMNTTRPTAVIVEGDPRLQRAMSKHFGRVGFHVLSASHFDGAVRHLAMCKPHVACVDVRLPSKSGYELCEHIRGSLGLDGLPIIMTSEYGSAEEMAYAEDAGSLQVMS